MKQGEVRMRRAGGFLCHGREGMLFAFFTGAKGMVFIAKRRRVEQKA
jgi:hypothetical protein